MIKTLGRLSCTLLLFSGCMGPVDGGVQNKTTSADKPSQRKNSAYSLIGNIVNENAVIKIGDATLEPSDVIQALDVDFREKFRRLPAQQFGGYVAQATTQYTTNRLSEMLLYQEATKRNTPKIEESINLYINGEIRKIVQAKHNGIERLYKQELSSQGQTIEDIREKMKREIIITSYLDSQIKPRMVEPTREQLMMAYQARNNFRPNKQRRKMSLIDVRINNQIPQGMPPTSELIEEAKRLARSAIESAHQELLQGADFAIVARKYSNGLHAQDGGSWNWISTDSVRERFLPAVNAVFQLQEGATSDILETADGFFIVHCDQIEKISESDFLQMQPQLTRNYYQSSYMSLVNDHVESLRIKAGIGVSQLEKFRDAVVQEAVSRYAINGP